MSELVKNELEDRTFKLHLKAMTNFQKFQVRTFSIFSQNQIGFFLINL